VDWTYHIKHLPRGCRNYSSPFRMAGPFHAPLYVDIAYRRTRKQPRLPVAHATPFLRCGALPVCIAYGRGWRSTTRSTTHVEQLCSPYACAYPDISSPYALRTLPPLACRRMPRPPSTDVAPPSLPHRDWAVLLRLPAHAPRRLRSTATLRTWTRWTRLGCGRWRRQERPRGVPLDVLWFSAT